MRGDFLCVAKPADCDGAHHLVSRQPVALLLDAGLGALAANSEGLNDQTVLHSQTQLSCSLLRVHAKHTAQVPVER